MKSQLIKVIKDLAGITSVEPFHISPDEPDQLFCIVTFYEKELRLSQEEVQLRNYAATEKRGLITDKTTIEDFVCKLREEVEELWYSSNSGKCSIDPSELADIVIVCESMALHYGIDLQKEKELKMYINEKRK